MRFLSMRLISLDRRALIYIALTYALTLAIDFLFIIKGNSGYKMQLLPVFARMWMPGIVALALSFFERDRTVTMLLRKRPALKSVALAYFFPLAVGLISLGLLYISKLTEFGPSPDGIAKSHGLLLFWLKFLVIAPILGLIVNMTACLGEEIGWRGYLLPKTKNLPRWLRWIFNGVIWSMWHWPLILFTDYAASSNKAYSVVMFTLLVTACAVFVCWLQEKSRSLWTSTVYHAAHNLWIIGIFPAFYRTNAKTPFFIGEGGVFLTVAYIMGVAALSLSPLFSSKLKTELKL